MTWLRISSQDRRGRELADRHPTRQTIGSRRFVAPGRCVVLLHETELALWCVVYNVYRGAYRFRNSLFRNESAVLSSDLVASATRETYVAWCDRYGALPDERLTTEIDVGATAARRSRRNEPGHCYRVAGWQEIRRARRAKRSETLCVLRAPTMLEVFS